MQESKKTSSSSQFINQINGEPVVPRNAVTITITEFDDATTKFPHTNKLSIKIRKNITLDGRLSVVAEKGDLELSGRISTFQIQPLSFSSQGIPVKKRILIISNVTLVDTKKNKIIFHNQPIQSFFEFSDQIPPIISDIQAIDESIHKLAERIQVQTINGWYTSVMTPVEKGKR
jgi:hypothetical protein